MEASAPLATPASTRAHNGLGSRTQHVGTVVTLLDQRLRSRVDLAGNGSFRTLHVDSALDILLAVRDRSVRVVLVSPQLLQATELPVIANVASQFSGVLAVAVSEDRAHPDLAQLLELGACGARCLVDLSAPEGLSRLRELAAQTYGHIAAEILNSLMPALAAATPDARYFFGNLVQRAPNHSTIRSFARALDALPSTLMSRFFRARLPSPKRYLAEIRILYAAALLELPDFSIAEVANRLGYSSPQSFGRHLREMKGVTAVEFRYRFAMRTAIDRFTAELISPYEQPLRSFVPLRRRPQVSAFRTRRLAMVAEP